MTGATPAAGAADAEVRGEAARLARRLEAAEQRLDAARAPASPPPPRAAESEVRRVDGTDRTDGVDRIDRIDQVDDEVRALLTPAANRVAELVELARALADGTVSDESADEAARTIAAAQPSRRPR
ncbi:hypothetical protein [Rhodococcus sp. IEGM 1408]|uniref:hypothetical protein n=1 Tax=Rhodococcus sp. IEGM 1408 TaxID=3082220 RepID=UPI00295536FA|nr:hypothetical protein [Rhodococcus sp. IEGM 1408]MDV8002278.1 hypothetical protein [Rhodococcus sp. IEGM 1408]